MSTKIFDMGIMACEDVQAWVKTIKFGATDESDNFIPAEIHDGAFVKVYPILADDTTYAGQKDWNVHIAEKPDDTEIADIAVVDISGVTEGVIAGNNYKIGSKQVDLKVAAGYPVRARVIKAGDKFWLGAGNFVSAPTVGEYATLTLDDTRLTPASTIEEGNTTFAILASKPMTIGTLVNYENAAFEQEYLVEAL